MSLLSLINSINLVQGSPNPLGYFPSSLSMMQSWAQLYESVDKFCCGFSIVGYSTLPLYRVTDNRESGEEENQCSRLVGAATLIWGYKWLCSNSGVSRRIRRWDYITTERIWTYSIKRKVSISIYIQQEDIIQSYIK